MARSKEEDAQWENHRDALRSMFLDQRLTVEQIRQYMSEKHNFSKSKDQYARQFKKWEFKKNYTDEDWRFVAHRCEKRKRAGKDPGPVRMHGNLIPEPKVRKEIGRHVLPSTQYLGSIDGNAEPRTPEGIVVGTPTAEVQSTDPSSSTLNFQSEWPLDPPGAEQAATTQEPDTDLTFASNTIPTDQSDTSHRGLASLNKELVEGIERLFTLSTSGSRRNLKDINEFLEPIAIESVHNDLIRKAKAIFQGDSADNLSHYLSLCVYLSSNNLLSYYAMNKLMMLLSKTKSHVMLKSLLQSRTTTTEIFMSDLLAGAAELGEVEIVRILINHGADIDATRGNFTRGTALSLAFSSNNINCVNLLLEAGADPNLAVQDRTPLQMACYQSIEIVELLLNSGAHVSPPQDSSRHSALQKAVALRKTNLVRLLLKWKAEPNSFSNPKTGTALQIACSSSSNAEIPELLINAGADIDARPRHKYSDTSSLHDAKYDSESESDSDSDSSLVGFEEIENGELFLFKSAILIAADNENWETVQVLLEEGAAVNPSMRLFPTEALEAEFGYDELDCPVVLTPLQASVRAQNITMTRMLLSAGAHVDARPKNKYGHTALQVAALVGNQRLVQILLLKGADINAAAGCHHGGMTALQAAALHNNTQLLTFLLNEGAEPNAPGTPNGGKSALRVAIEMGNIDAVSILLDAGSSVNIHQSCKEGLQALQDSIRIRNLIVRDRIVSLLLQAGASFLPPAGHERYGGLHTAVYNKDIDMTRKLLQKGASPNIGCSSFNNTILQEASSGGNEALVQLLISHGADINAPAYYSKGRTALQHAAFHNYMNIVKILLDAGADVRAPKAVTDGISAVEAAIHARNEEMIQLFLDTDPGIISCDPFTKHNAVRCAFSHWECSVSFVKFLLKNGAVVNISSRFPSLMPCLQTATMRGNFEMVQCLLNAGADVNFRWISAKNATRVTALQAAVATRNIDIVQMLIEWGADVNAPAHPIAGGQTALQIAVSHNYFEMVQLLVQKGADINSVPSPRRGRTALQEAASSGYLKLTQYLLQRNAEVNAPAAPFCGITALQGASIGGNIRIVMMLLAAGADINAAPAIEDGRNAIEGAAENGRLDTLHLLLNRHPNKITKSLRSKEREQQSSPSQMDILQSVDSCWHIEKALGSDTSSHECLRGKCGAHDIIIYLLSALMLLSIVY